MARARKTFAAVEASLAGKEVPLKHSLALDLVGLKLSDDELAEVRQEAVKAALLKAASLVGKAGAAMDSFSTFSTFSTFGSSVGRQVELPSEIPAEARGIIGRVLG
jgi:hypothetical protein